MTKANPHVKSDALLKQTSWKLPHGLSSRVH